MGRNGPTVVYLAHLKIRKPTPESTTEGVRVDQPLVHDPRFYCRVMAFTGEKSQTKTKTMYSAHTACTRQRVACPVQEFGLFPRVHCANSFSYDRGRRQLINEKAYR